jgi:hypothetical protein
LQERQAIEDQRSAIVRNVILAATRRLDRKIWKKWSVDHRSSLVKTKMRPFKLLGERVVGREFDRKVAELQVRTAILDRFTRLDKLTNVAVTMQ